MVALGLQKRGTGGEHTEAVDDVYDISNAARLKKSEVSFLVCATCTMSSNYPHLLTLVLVVRCSDAVCYHLRNSSVGL